jgi:Xaa-Pro dipeptidase
VVATASFARYGPIGHREEAFPPPEYHQRRERVRARLQGEGLDALITFSPTNITYLCGHSSGNVRDFQCLILPQADDPVLVLWYFELGRFHATATGARTEAYDTAADPVGFTIDVLRKYGWYEDAIGVDGGMGSVSAGLVQQLIGALPARRARLVTGIVERVRVVKSPAEVDVLRRAAHLTATGTAAAIRAVRAGATDFEIAAEANRALLAAGSLYLSTQPYIAAGWRGGVPHSNAAGYVVAPGDTVFIELGGTVARYTAPIMRTACVGAASQHVTRLAQISLDALDAILQVTRPGVPASDVAAAGDRVVSRIPDDVIFHYTYGYPVGIGYPPTWMEESAFFLVRSNHEPLEAGMVFHLPLSLRSYGRFGIGFSETVHVTDRGPDILTAMIPRELVVRE